MADSDYKLAEVLDTYRLDGSMVRTKARVLLEEWIDRIYPRMQDPETPTSSLLDIGKALIELGDMKPKNQAAPPNQGAGFSITINIPQGGDKEPITINGTVTDNSDPDDATFDPFPERPIHLADFSLEKDLIGE